MSIAFVFLCFIVLLANPSAHSLSVMIIVVPCGHPISSRVFLMGTPAWPLTKVDAISASAADAITNFRMLAIIWTAPFRGGGGAVGSGSPGSLK